jgi:hypothetical protein
MPKFDLLNATRTIEHAMPFVLYRFMVYLGLAMAYLFAALAGAGTFVAFASFTKNPSSVASLGALLGLAGCGYLVYKFRSSLLFNLKVGQLALLGEQAKGSKLPEGKAQIEFAKQTAAASLTPALFHEIGEATATVAREMAKTSPALRAPADNQALSLACGAVAAHATQAVLVNHFRHADGNAWRAAETGLLQMQRHFKLLFSFELYALAFEYIGLLIAFIAMIYPANWVASSLPVDVGWWRYVFALIFAWSIKGAFFAPIATTAMAHALLSLPDLSEPETANLRSELELQVPAFRELCAKAS